MCKIPRQNPLEESMSILKNEQQEGKIGPVLGWVLVGMGG
jgi:hypothetical protein